MHNTINELYYKHKYTSKKKKRQEPNEFFNGT